MKLPWFAVACVCTSIALAADENLLKSIATKEAWRLETHEGAAATVAVEEGAATYDVTKSTGTDWHVQVVHSDLLLKEGKTYTLKFKAKAAAPCSIGLNAMIDEEDWHQIGLGEMVYLGKEFESHTFTFVAENVSTKKNRISFVLGGEKCKVTLKDIELTAK